MQRGFTLIELMTVLAVFALLIATSFPTYSASLRKARRANAITQLAFIEHRQENWRAVHAGYASLAELGMGPDALGTNYALSITAAGPAGYIAVAEARGTQFDDEPCRVLMMRISGSNTSRASGPDATLGNDARANSRCWLQ